MDGARSRNVEGLIEMGAQKGSVRVVDERRRVTQSTLRDLARRPRAERHRMLRGAHVAVDPDETAAWDATLADRIH